MYKPLLILKYLGKRRIAWVSLIAVMLCTAMVLVVISVMSGWLGMFRASFQGLSGDLVVRSPGLSGFAHYEAIGEVLEADPRFEAAVPTIETFGLINFEGRVQKGVQVMGVPMDRIGLVNRFPESLYLQNPDISPQQPLADWREKQAAWAERMGSDGLLDAEDIEQRRKVAEGLVEEWAAQKSINPTFDLPWPEWLYQRKLDDMRASEGGRRRGGNRTRPDVMSYPGIIAGSSVLGLRRDENGDFDRWEAVSPVTPGSTAGPILAKIVLLAVDPNRPTVNLEEQKAEFSAWVVDNSHTGVFERDQTTVYAPLDYVQRQLRMDTQYFYDEFADDGTPIGDPAGVDSPAKVHELHIAVADGVDLDAARDAAEAIVFEVLDGIEGGYAHAGGVRVEKWEERYARFLNAVERERALVVTLFGFISIVAVFLILCIFYMIVKEKTRDIGIIKSVGATAGGIAAIFLGYGAAIGLAGGLLGLVAGGLVVHYINGIHDLMASLLGIEIWRADTYMFDKIPNTVDPLEAGIIFAAAVVSSIVGAVVPAIRAATLRPVEALRFE